MGYEISISNFIGLCFAIDLSRYSPIFSCDIRDMNIEDFDNLEEEEEKAVQALELVNRLGLDVNWDYDDESSSVDSLYIGLHVNNKEISNINSDIEKLKKILTPSIIQEFVNILGMEPIVDTEDYKEGRELILHSPYAKYC